LALSVALDRFTDKLDEKRNNYLVCQLIGMRVFAIPVVWAKHGALSGSLILDGKKREKVKDVDIRRLLGEIRGA
jgi:hypothetical protein